MRLELQGCGGRRRNLRRFLEAEIWSLIPDDVRGNPLTKEGEEEIRGLGRQTPTCGSERSTSGSKLAKSCGRIPRSPPGLSLHRPVTIVH